MRLIDYGQHAVLAEYDDLGSVVQVAESLRRGERGLFDDVVVAARTILVRFAERPADLDRLLHPPPAVFEDASRVGAPAAPVIVSVRYDGEDLAAVAARVGVGPHELIEMHTAPTYTVAFCGFAPGFGYLIGSMPELHLPRRDTPRTRVPAGAVAIAGPFTGVYPTPAPGGWHLLGRSDAVLFDPERDPPALLAPGARVRFVAS